VWVGGSSVCDDPQRVVWQRWKRKRIGGVGGQPLVVIPRNRGAIRQIISWQSWRCLESTERFGARDHRLSHAERSRRNEPCDHDRALNKGANGRLARGQAVDEVIAVAGKGLDYWALTPRRP
jgi:hypothetical protein